MFIFSKKSSTSAAAVGDLGIFLHDAGDDFEELFAKLFGLLQDGIIADVLKGEEHIFDLARITEPCVEDTEGLVFQGIADAVRVVVSADLRLLGPGDKVGLERNLAVVGEGFVSPQGASDTHTGLHLIDDHDDTVLVEKFLHLGQKAAGAVLVAAFGLDRFDNGAADTSVVTFDDKAVSSNNLIFLLLGRVHRRIGQFRGLDQRHTLTEVGAVGRMEQRKHPSGAAVEGIVEGGHDLINNTKSRFWAKFS